MAAVGAVRLPAVGPTGAGGSAGTAVSGVGRAAAAAPVGSGDHGTAVGGGRSFVGAPGDSAAGRTRRRAVLPGAVWQRGGGRLRPGGLRRESARPLARSDAGGVASRAASAGGLACRSGPPAALPLPRRAGRLDGRLSDRAVRHAGAPPPALGRGPAARSSGRDRG